MEATTGLQIVPPTKVATNVVGGMLQRSCACGRHTNSSGECADCGKARKSVLHRSRFNRGFANDSGNEVPPIVHDVLRSSGQPLDASARAYMESRFGHDFSRVRVHTDVKAAESVRAVNALAYTVGRDVVFGAGRYAPAALEGQRLLAHELTHVVQQSGAGDLTPGAIEIGASGTVLEREADATAERITSESPKVQVNPSATAPSAMLQRACPTPPTGLGATPGAEPCDRTGEAAVAGSTLLFCQDSDELTPGQGSWLASLTADSKKATNLEIHGNASPEGPAGDPDYNFRLACKRAAAIAANFRSAGATVSIKLITHGPTSAYGPAESNRNVVVVMTLAGPTPTPTPTPPTPAPTPTPTPAAPSSAPTCTPGAGIPNSVCGAYAANSWWLPLAYVSNATCACSSTPNTPEYNCIRKTLQDRLAATPAPLKTLASSMKPLESSLNPINFLAYKAFVLSNLTPVIYADHVIAYASCCCVAGPAPYSAWELVTTVPVPSCAAVGASIALAGSCHGTPGTF